MRQLTKLQRKLLERLEAGAWVRANIDHVILHQHGHDSERVLMNTFTSVHARGLVEVWGANPPSSLMAKKFVISNYGRAVLKV